MMSMPTVLILRVPITVNVIVDTQEMDRIVQVCFKHTSISLPNTLICVINFFHFNFVNHPDINECLIEELCADNAECHDTEGSFECTCVSGYSGDGDYNCTGVFYTFVFKIT